MEWNTWYKKVFVAFSGQPCHHPLVNVIIPRSTGSNSSGTILNQQEETHPDVCNPIGYYPHLPCTVPCRHIGQGNEVCTCFMKFKLFTHVLLCLCYRTREVHVRTFLQGMSRTLRIKIEKVGTKRISTCIELLGSDYFLYLVPVWNLLCLTVLILVTLADGSSAVPIKHVRSGFTQRNFGQQISWQVHRWRRSCQYQKVKLKLQMYKGFTWF